MRVLITGIDGYLGWPLALYLSARGHEVSGIDNGLRRSLVRSVNSTSAIPIYSMKDRVKVFPYHLRYYVGDLTDCYFVRRIYKKEQPEAIVYLGEIPSAPYSMKGIREATITHDNNVGGTLVTLYAMHEFCPDAHLVKLGTMGEYGTPGCPLPEGKFPSGSEWIINQHGPGELGFNVDGKLWGTGESCGNLSDLMFPRQPGSWYHATKVHDTHNVEMACRLWGLRSTDIMQGVVYGTQIDEMDGRSELATRFDFDECFGTVVNRFCTQAAIGVPLTPYGKGNQSRGFLPLRDSMQCLTLALENPPGEGEYRTFNQFQSVYSINDLALYVQTVAQQKHGLDTRIQHIENPRKEQEEHAYEPECKHLFHLGYKPQENLLEELESMVGDLLPHRDRIKLYARSITPSTRWSGGNVPCEPLPEPRQR